MNGYMNYRGMLRRIFVWKESLLVSEKNLEEVDKARN